MVLRKAGDRILTIAMRYVNFKAKGTEPNILILVKWYRYFILVNSY